MSENGEPRVFNSVKKVPFINIINSTIGIIGSLVRSSINNTLETTIPLAKKIYETLEYQTTLPDERSHVPRDVKFHKFIITDTIENSKKFANYLDDKLNINKNFDQFIEKIDNIFRRESRDFSFDYTNYFEKDTKDSKPKKDEKYFDNLRWEYRKERTRAQEDSTRRGVAVIPPKKSKASLILLFLFIYLFLRELSYKPKIKIKK